MHLAELYVHPLKSGRGVRHGRAFAGQAGLLGDRSWMLTTPQGEFITARSHPMLTQVRVTMIPGALLLQAPGMPLRAAISAVYTQPVPTSVWGDDFAAWHGDVTVDAWFSEFLGQPCQLLFIGEAPQRQQKTQAAPLGFADGYPYLLAGEGSLADLNGQLATPVSMRHFRPNLVIAGSGPYEEDDWTVIRIGPVVFDVAKPCTRCVLTTVDPATGQPAADQEPLATLMRTRQFDDGVRFGQNLAARNEGLLEVGMEVEVLETALAF